jgi:hypothetical protein
MHKKLSLGLCLLLAAEPALAAPCAFEGNPPSGAQVVVYNSPGGTNSTAGITTTQSNEPIFLTFFASSEQAAGPGPVVTGITGGGLTFTKRVGLGGQLITACISSPQNCLVDFEVWEAEASSPLTGQAFAVTATTGGATGAILGAFGLANTTSPSSPWDPSGSLPATTSDINGTGSVPVVTGVSTSNTNDLILQFCGTANNIGQFSCTGQQNTGWSIATASASFLNSFVNYQIGSGVYYKTVSSTLSGVTLDAIATISGGADPTTSTRNWINFGDAIKCAGPAPPPTGAIPHVWVNE